MARFEPTSKPPSEDDKTGMNLELDRIGGTPSGSVVWSSGSDTPESGASIMTPSTSSTLSAMQSLSISPLDQLEPVQTRSPSSGDVAAIQYLSMDSREAELDRMERDLDERRAEMTRRKIEVEHHLAIVPDAAGVRIPGELVQAFQDLERRMADLDAAHEATHARHDICTGHLEGGIEALRRQLAGAQQRLSSERADREAEIMRYEEARGAIMLELTTLRAEVAKLLRRA